MQLKLVIIPLISLLVGAAAGFEFGTRNAAGSLSSFYRGHIVSSALGRIDLSSQALADSDPTEARRRLMGDIRQALIEVGGNASEDKMACNENQKSALLRAKSLNLGSATESVEQKLISKGLRYCD